MVLDKLRTDIVYLVCIRFTTISVLSIIVDKIVSDKEKKEPFFTKVLNNKEYWLISCLNYIRFTLLTTALSFKNIGIVIATYNTYPIFTAIMSKTILYQKIYKEEIAGIIIAMIGILIINYTSFKELFVTKFSKITLYTPLKL